MVPAGHGVHAMSADACPEEAQYPPSWQSSQRELPRPSLNLPCAHGVQVVLPFPSMSEYEPGEQGMQLALLPAPSTGRNVPCGQGVGKELPVGQKCPGQQ